MVTCDYKLTVLYASQTGNAEDAAERIGREAERRGCATEVQSMDTFEASCLPYKDTVIFVVSTTGQGDIPDPMKVFWKFILQRNLSKHWLEGVCYAVFGLGDSGYQKYNFAAKKLDTRIAGLGAKSLIERGLGDDQNPSGYEGSLDPWMSSLWRILIELKPEMLPRGLAINISDVKLLDEPKVQITYFNAEQLYSQFPSFTETKCIKLQIERARSMSVGNLSRDKSKPDCLLRLIKNQTLTTPDCGKDVCHFEFEAHSCEIQYEVGDVLEILPRQKRSLVEAFIRRCSLDPDLYIIVQPKGRESPIHNDPCVTNIPIKLSTFVELTMDVASASPRRYFFEVMSAFATVELEKERLQYFASPEGRDDLYQYNQKERRSVLEVLEDFPSVRMPFEWLVQLVPPLKTRAFSISSSPAVHPNQVHLTVNIVTWTTPYKRKRTGLCSTWLAGLDPYHNLADKIPVWFHKGSLPRPQPLTPLILVGPGTGCAPFRGFIEDRACIHGPIGPILFFFGCRDSHSDFLYRDFWAAHSRCGSVLSENNGGGFYAAFSREQPEKIYVQQKMREQRKRVWDLLCEGACVYVAGSSSKMPSDVLSAFEEIVSEEGGVSKESAARWLKALEKAGKYHVEAWS